MSKKLFAFCENEIIFRLLKDNLNALFDIQFLDDLEDIKIDALNFSDEIIILIEPILPNKPLELKHLDNVLNLYFYFIQKEYFNFKLIILSTYSSVLLKALYQYPEIFHLPKIFFVELKNNASFIKFKEIINQPQQKLLQLKDYYYILKHLKIYPTKSYDDHHSMANRWTFLLWSEILQPGSFSTTFDNELYLNYLYTLYKIKNKIINTTNSKDILNKLNNFDLKNIKFLVLTDEPYARNFWNKFFENIDPKDYLITIDNNLQDKNDLKKNILQLIQQSEPEIIITDMFLLKREITNHLNANELLSYEIIKETREKINGGIQFILFTAQNNFQYISEFTKLNITNFVIKPSPLSNYSFIQQQLSHLIQSIQSAKENIYLVNTYKKIIKIKDKLNEINLLNDSSNKNSKDITKYAIIDHLHMHFKLLQKAHDEDDYAYAFITIFQVMEQFINLLFKVTKNNELFIKDKKLNRYIKYDKDTGKYKIMDSNFTTQAELSIGMKFIHIYLHYIKKIDINKLLEITPEMQNEFEHIYTHFNARNIFIHNRNNLKNYRYKEIIFKPNGSVKLLNYLYNTIMAM